MFYVPNKPFRLFALAEENEIKVEFYDFKNPKIEALYVSEPGLPPVIGLSKSLFENGAHFQTVFAHEMGHHFTSAKSTVPKAFFYYRDRLQIGRDEHRAMAWAARYLIPKDDLENAISDGITKTWELSERFQVDESLVKLRLILYFERERKGA